MFRFKPRGTSLSRLALSLSQCPHAAEPSKRDTRRKALVSTLDEKGKKKPRKKASTKATTKFCWEISYFAQWGH
jgi:hypothetical protein